MHRQPTLGQPVGGQPQNAINAGKAVRVGQRLRAKRRGGMHSRQTRGEGNRIIGNAGKARRPGLEFIGIMVGEFAPQSGIGGGIPAAMQGRFLAQFGVIPQARADKFHAPRVDIEIGQERCEIAECEAALRHKHRVIRNFPQRFHALQRLVIGHKFGRDIANAVE